MPELLDFPSDLVHLEAASKVSFLFMLALLFSLSLSSLSLCLIVLAYELRSSYCTLIVSKKLQIELKTLAEEMQAAAKGLGKVEHELSASENDGAISLGFRKVSYM